MSTWERKQDRSVLKGPDLVFASTAPTVQGEIQPRPGDKVCATVRALPDGRYAWETYYYRGTTSADTTYDLINGGVVDTFEEAETTGTQVAQEKAALLPRIVYRTGR